MEPLITVVMPVYNGGAFVARALASVWDQSHKNFELLVIDDGSTDDTADIITDTLATLTRRGTTAARLIRHPENLGYGAATNTAIHEARGDWITFVDSDDTVEPQYLERLLASVQTHNANLAMVRLRTVDESGRLGLLGQPFPATGVSTNAEALRKTALGELVLSQHVLISRNLWGQTDACTDNAYSDVIFLLQLLGKCQRMAYVDEALYNYTIHPGSVTGSLRPSVWDLAMLHEPSWLVFSSTFDLREAAVLHRHFELQILWQILQKAAREPAPSQLRTTIATWVRHRTRFTDLIWLAGHGKPALAGSFALAKLSPHLHRQVYGHYKRLKAAQAKSANDPDVTGCAISGTGSSASQISSGDRP
jgi:hypothetical protein